MNVYIVVGQIRRALPRRFDGFVVKSLLSEGLSYMDLIIWCARTNLQVRRLLTAGALGSLVVFAGFSYPVASAGPVISGYAPVMSPLLTVSDGIIRTFHAVDQPTEASSRGVLTVAQYTRGQWRSTPIVVLPRMNISALATVCNSVQCLAAIETDPVWSRTEPFSLSVYRHQMKRPGWYRVWRIRLPAGVGAGQIMLAQSGRLVWLLVDGTPSASMMPKVLYLSRDRGVHWTALANQGAGNPSPITLPDGYPTGITALRGGRLIMTVDTGTSSLPAAVEYRANPPSQGSISLPSRANDGLIAPFPAVTNGTIAAIPAKIVPTTTGATRFGWFTKEGARWVFHRVRMTLGSSELSEHDTVVFWSAHAIHIVTLGHSVITLPIPPADGRAVAIAVEAPDRLAVLTSRHAVWIKTFHESGSSESQ